jgi:hypothetical protein
MLLDRLDGELVDLVLETSGPGVRTPFLVTELRQLGAATSRDVDGGSAVGGRDAAFALTMIGVPDPSLFAEVLPGALAAFKPKVAPWIAETTNIHWTEWHSPADVERSWPPATLERLKSVRAAVDPGRRFAFGAAAH